jgi:hypothetical protein
VTHREGWQGSRPNWVIDLLRPFLEAHIGQGWESALRDWKLESRYFSSVILFSVEGSTALSGRFFAKLPKAARGRGHEQVPARVPADLELAAQEKRALEVLSATWQSDTASYVNPRFFDPHAGMLVFDYVSGHDLYDRRLPVRLLWGNRMSAFCWALERIGDALAAYHACTEMDGEYDTDRLLKKVEVGADALGAPSGGSIPSPGFRRITRLVKGIKGFELRNIRVGPDKIWLFDPGRLRDEPPEADIARFLVSIRICAWGTPYFPIPLKTQFLERAFLAGYGRIRLVDHEILRLFVLREILWNWREAWDVVAVKQERGQFLRPFRHAYVNLAFRRLWQSAIKT